MNPLYQKIKPQLWTNIQMQVAKKDNNKNKVMTKKNNKWIHLLILYNQLKSLNC